MTRFVFALAVLSLCAAPMVARADWDYEPGNPLDKWVQLPDPYGWDVKVTPPKILADDFLCVDPLPITDVHFWGSWADDMVGKITNVHLSIHSDLVGAVPSQPDILLWDKDFDDTMFTVRKWHEEGLQGWYNPNTGQYWPDNHQEIYQVNIDLCPEQWFWQDGDPENPVWYWLDIQVTVADPVCTDFGWKTSIDHNRDNAVWRDECCPPEQAWEELYDPVSGESLDMAFVITTIPEPGVFVIAAIGLLALLRSRRK